MANYSCHAGHNLGQRNLTAGNTRQNGEQQPGQISTRAAALETSNETPKKTYTLAGQCYLYFVAVAASVLVVVVVGSVP